MGLEQPRTLPGGERVWIDGQVADFVDALHRLDDRLSLTQTPDGRWSIWRVAEDGTEHRVCISGPGARLDQSIIHHLALNDSRRFDVAGDMIRANEQRIAAVDAKAEEDKMVAYDKMLSKAWKGRVPKTDVGFETMT